MPKKPSSGPPAPPAPGPSTLSVHGGEPRLRPGRSLTAPLIQSSTYPFEHTAELIGHMEGRIDRPPEYGRYGNPTVADAEARLAALEGAEAALLAPSGMSAITTSLLAMLRAGQHLVLTSDVYRKTRVFAGQVLQRYGVEVSVVEPELDAVRAALRPNTRVVLTELPTNPYLRVVDLAALAEAAHGVRAKVLVDATFATPLNLRPLEHGADLVLHSTTKYLGGHNDHMGGVAVGAAPLIDAIRELAGTLGPVAAPQEAWLLLRGLKTLGLRMQRHNESALRLARRLEAHPQVRQVWYPLLESHPDYAVASRLLKGGGGVISFELAGGLAAGTRLVDAVQLPRLAPSLGGVESLIEQPALMSFFELGPEGRAAIGIREGLVRYSVGIEDVEDLERDLVEGLEG